MKIWISMMNKNSSYIEWLLVLLLFNRNCFGELKIFLIINICMRQSHIGIHFIDGLSRLIVQITSIWTSCFKNISPKNDFSHSLMYDA